MVAPRRGLADGQALVTDEVAVTPTEYVAQDPDLAIRTTTEYVLEHLDDENVVMCDARNGEEYAGTDVRSAARWSYSWRNQRRLGLPRR